MDTRRPCVRPDLEFLPIRHEGQTMVLIRDPLGIVQEGRAISLSLYRMLTLLDGSMDPRDLQTALMREQGGVLVGHDEIARFLSFFEGEGILIGPRYSAARDAIVTAFTASGTRPASHAGTAYPSDPSELRRRLEEILGSAPPPEPVTQRLLGLVAPHIDLGVGARGYARAYQTLRGASPTRVIVLGVGHHLGTHLFSLTHKDFETPLGLLRTDRDLVAELMGLGGRFVSPDDFVHRSEHSLEFQALFLRHLFPGPQLCMVPILCGSIPACLGPTTREDFLQAAGPLLRRLRDLVAEPDSETLLVAGVDMSHIGPKFGDPYPSDYLRSQAQAHDRSLLEGLTAQAPEAFWEESLRVEDRFHVCGFPALAAFLEILPKCHARVLHYETWDETATESAVSFAAALFSL